MGDPAIFSFRLRHVREERGMSQTALASGICSASAISRWESGQSVPSAEIIRQLANRLGLPAEILTQRDFDSRLLTSCENFGDLVESAFGSGISAIEGSPMASWISRVWQVFRQADPWSVGPDPRPVVDDLAVDPITASVPVSAEIVELLDAMARVRETQDRETVSALTDTLSWTIDAPKIIRRAAMEIVVAVLVSAGMPIEARKAVMQTDLSEITATTALLLTWDGSSADGLPPVTADRSARDVAFGVLIEIRDMPVQDRERIETAIRRSCSKDDLVAQWTGVH